MSTSIDYTTPTPRFSVLDDKSLHAGLAYLDEHGYAVISDVLDEEGIKTNKSLLWKFLEDPIIGTIQRDDPETWSTGWPTFSTHGVINGSGIGQSDFLWNVRSNPQVKRVFSKIWNDPALLVSFDGCGVFRDWRYNADWKTSGGWNHVDQNPKTKPDRCCIQGFVSLTDQSERTGGLIVYPKTMRHFTELSDVTKNKDDFVKVSDSHPIMCPERTSGKLVHCQGGDLVLWDSRTVHCNTPATATAERSPNEPVDLVRIAAYVSMNPVSMIPSDALEEFRERRKKIVENNQTLTHWSTQLVIARGKNTDLPKVSLDRFTDYQTALIFGEPYSAEE